MRYTLPLGWLLLVPGLVSGAFAIPDLHLSGEYRQGGLVIGRTAPSAHVELGGRMVRVSRDGVFLLGFGRDAPPELRLVVTASDGSRVERALEIEPRDYAVQRINGLSKRKVDPTAEDLVRIRAEQSLVERARARDDPRTDFLTGFQWPVVGRVTGTYGSQRILNGAPRQPHYGIDIAAVTGTPVRAPADGVVTLAHPDMFFSGGTLMVDHGHGLQSAFLHLHRILVREGQRVHRGDVVAQVGATGRVTGAHLDWRINWFDQRLDPAFFVPPMPALDESG